MPIRQNPSDIPIVAIGTTAPFEVLSIDAEKRRIGIALVPEGSARETTPRSASHDIVVGARLKGKVDRHEPFGVFVFLAPGRTGLMPLSETGVAKEADVVKAFPIGSDVDVVVLEVDATGRRIRVSRKAIMDAQDADELREYKERTDAGASTGVGSLADQLRGALASRNTR